MYIDTKIKTTNLSNYFRFFCVNLQCQIDLTFLTLSKYLIRTDFVSSFFVLGRILGHSCNVLLQIPVVLKQNIAEMSQDEKTRTLGCFGPILHLRVHKFLYCLLNILSSKQFDWKPFGILASISVKRRKHCFLLEHQTTLALD